MDRRRRARDQMPGGPRNLSTRESFRSGTEGAHDRALAEDATIRAINRKGFLARFPDAAKIRVLG
jgi:hypothetical protein